jgi:hypothetical protein
MPRRSSVTKITIRVRVMQPMTLGQVRLLLDEAFETGTVPPGIEIRWMDWERGIEGRMAQGQITGRIRKALGDLRRLYAASEKRFARVR